MRPDRFFNYVYAWSVERVENRDEFDENLVAPLPNDRRTVRRPTAAEVEQEGAAFMDFMGAVNG